MPRNSLRACALRSNRRGKSDHEAVALCGATATSQTPRHRRMQKGWGANSQTSARAIAALGPKDRAERSDGLFGIPTPFCQRRGAQGVGWQLHRRVQLHRELTHRVCLSGARKRVASYAVQPMPAHRRLPRSEAKGTLAAGRASLGTFLSRDNPASARSADQAPKKHRPPTVNPKAQKAVFRAWGMSSAP